MAYCHIAHDCLVGNNCIFSNNLVIEGNIGAGKTTVVNILENLGYPVVREGVDVWGDILAAFYDNNMPLSQTSWT